MIISQLLFPFTKRIDLLVFSHVTSPAAPFEKWNFRQTQPGSNQNWTQVFWSISKNNNVCTYDICTYIHIYSEATGLNKLGEKHFGDSLGEDSSINSLSLDEMRTCSSGWSLVSLATRFLTKTTASAGWSVGL